MSTAAVLSSDAVQNLSSESVRELASISFGRSGEGIFLALRMYFDGSGKENDHPVINGWWVPCRFDCMRAD